MNKLIRLIFTFLFISILGACYFQTHVSAADKVEFKVDDVTVKKGDTVSVPVKVSNNTGMASAAFEFTIPEGFTLTNIAKGPVFSEGTYTYLGDNLVSWFVMDNISENGVILELNLTVGEDAKSGQIGIAALDADPMNFMYFTDLVNYVDDLLPCTFVPGTITVEAEGHEHSYDAEVTKEPTCTEKGIKTYSCAECGDKYTEEIKAKGHTEVTDKAEEASCTKDGKTAGTHCSVCNEVIKAQEVVKATGHSWDEGKIIKAATCTEDGEMTFTCTACQEAKTEVVKAKGHTEVEDKAEAASCTKDGKTAGIHCSVCNEIIKAQEVVKAKGHTEVEDKAEEASCTKDGKTVGTHCSTCNTILQPQETLKAYGHDYQLVAGSAVDPTCAVDGKEADEKCSRCQDVKSGAVIKATGHVWDNGIVVKEADCITVGEKLFTCSICDTSKTVGIPVTDHTYVSVYAKATLTASGYKAQKCTVCKNVKDKITYSYPKSIALSKTAYAYTAKVSKPTVTVVGADGKVIAATNYTLTYSNAKSTNVGKYTVKVTFKGNYSGSKSLTYKINPKSTKISTLTPASKAFTANWAKMTTQSTGYQLQYALTSNFSGAVSKTIKKNTTVSFKVSSLKAKKKYYVRVRTYKTISGVNYYSAWSPVKTVVTK